MENATKRQPNILLIMTDQMRGDCMGTAGHPDVKTPNLDHLAACGVRYTNAYTACPSCIPARCALHTGLKQEHHGRVGYQDRVPWQYPVTMAGALAKAGYYTQCVGKMHVHPLRNLMGFHNVELHDGYLHAYRNGNVPYVENQRIADDYFYWLKTQLGIDRDVTDMGLECNSFTARPWMYEERLHPTNWVTDRSIDFLRRRDRSMPFFLMASYLRPHPPFDAPEYFFSMYRDMELTPPPIGDWADADRLRRLGRFTDADTGSCDPELMRQARIGYYACISHLDNQIGRLLDALRDDGCHQDTVILFTSDHGELLGDHHTFRKTRPYQGSIHIPLLMARVPGIKPGSVSDRLTELRDILPTLTELAGVDTPEGVDGVSLLQDPDREYLHGEHSGGDLGNHYIVTKTDKYCWFTQSGREQYFRLDKDPKELHDAIEEPDCQERIAHLRSLLIQELTGREEGYTDGLRLIPGRPEKCCLSFLPPRQQS
ncbi:arylsulfatase [bacterium D16-50]|jgi:arylsulfatase|nr:arylsulfatase [Lachnospiraceae bacterium]RKJ20139.1 arylsulfatase [bacterium D16-50]